MSQFKVLRCKAIPHVGTATVVGLPVSQKYLSWGLGFGTTTCGADAHDRHNPAHTLGGYACPGATVFTPAHRLQHAAHINTMPHDALPCRRAHCGHLRPEDSHGRMIQKEVTVCRRVLGSTLLQSTAKHTQTCYTNKYLQYIQRSNIDIEALVFVLLFSTYP